MSDTIRNNPAWSAGNTPTDQAVIDIRGLDFRYDGSPVLQGVDLTVRRGDFIAVLGPNGGGKTTLLKLILGLLRPDEGTVRVFGRDPAQGLRGAGYVPQQTGMVPGFPITALEATLMGVPGARRGFGYSKANREHALTMLERVGVADLATRRMDRISGGQRQRVLIARAMASSPELLVFDEPTANIDPQGKQCVYELLTELSRGLTVVVVSHDMVLATSRISRLAAVNRTLISGDGPILTESMLELIYGPHHHQCAVGHGIQSIAGLFGPHSHSLLPKGPTSTDGDLDA